MQTRFVCPILRWSKLLTEHLMLRCVSSILIRLWRCSQLKAIESERLHTSFHLMHWNERRTNSVSTIQRNGRGGWHWLAKNYFELEMCLGNFHKLNVNCTHEYYWRDGFEKCWRHCKWCQLIPTKLLTTMPSAKNSIQCNKLTLNCWELPFALLHLPLSITHPRYVVQLLSTFYYWWNK